MSKYDEYLAELRKYSESAHAYIPKMCQALREEDKHISNEDIRDKVTKDCLEAGLSKSTIMHYLPEDLKDADKVKAGKKSAEERKKKIAVAATGESLLQGSAAESNPNDEKEQYSGTSQAEETVKKFYPDIDKEPKYFKTEDDPEFLKDRLNKALETIRDKDLIIESKDKTIGELQDIEKKRSFTSASELQDEGEKVTLVVDTLNVDHFPSVNIGSFLSVQSSLKNRGWKRVALWVKVLE